MSMTDRENDFDPVDGDLSRFAAKPEDVYVFLEERMQCRSCARRTGQPLECEVYEKKPTPVLYGEPVCPDFEKDAARAEDEQADGSEEGRMRAADHEDGYGPDEGDLSRFTARPGDIYVFLEEKMQCRSCVNRMGQPLECEIYEQKPTLVLYGEPVCPDFAADTAESESDPTE